MDALDLLAREDEFKKLNRQLEKKTESLMKEIEHAMQKQDIFSDFSHSLSLSSRKHTPTPNSTPTKTNEKTPKSSPKNNPPINKEKVPIDGGTIIHDVKDNIENVNYKICECTSKERIDGDLGFLYAFVSISVQERLLPASFLKDRVTVEGVCKFLSSKVKLMQDQIDKIQATMDKKAAQCEQHLTQIAVLEGEKMGMLNRMNSAKAGIVETKAKHTALKKKLEEKDRLYKEIRSENDKLSLEAKRLRLKNANMEARCASQEESISNLKHQLETAKRAEKEFRDSARHLSSAHETSLSKLEGRIKLLTSRSNKQMALIENLRKQNALLATEKATQALERDYSQFILRFS